MSKIESAVGILYSWASQPALCNYSVISVYYFLRDLIAISQTERTGRLYYNLWILEISISNLCYLINKEVIINEYDHKNYFSQQSNSSNWYTNVVFIASLDNERWFNTTAWRVKIDTRLCCVDICIYLQALRISAEYAHHWQDILCTKCCLLK